MMLTVLAARDEPAPCENREPAAGGDIKDVLEEVYDLIKVAVTHEVDRASRDSLLTGVEPDDDAVWGTTERLVAEARSSVDFVLSDEAVDEDWARVRRVARTTARVPVRALCPQSVARRELGQAHHPTGRDLHIRVTDAPLQEAVIVDGEVVRSSLAQGRPAEQREQAGRAPTGRPGTAGAAPDAHR
jgi:hypothetical protein